jgi:hypothetical protein
MMFQDSVLASRTMADKEYVSLSVSPDAREALRDLVRRLSYVLGRDITMTDAILISAGVTTTAAIYDPGLVTKAADDLHVRA